MSAVAAIAAVPRVSCVVIFHDTDPRFLDEAIESIRAQSFRAFEIVLVDDGSTREETIRAARRHARAEPATTRYVTHPDGRNRGMSASRNAGIAASRGEFVAFLDSDDVWEPFTLAEQVDILDRHADACMVFGPIRYWYGWAGDAAGGREDWTEDKARFPWPTELFTNVVIAPPKLFSPLVQARLGISGMLVRRSAVDAVDGFEERFTGLYEDQVLCAKLCLRFPVFSAARQWYRYRQHERSCSAVANEARGADAWLENRDAFLAWLTAHLEADGRWLPLARAVVRKERLLCRYPALRALDRHLTRARAARLARRAR